MKKNKGEANECHTNGILNNRWKDTKRKATLISFPIFYSHEWYSFRVCIRLIFGGFYLRSLVSNLYFQRIKRLKLPVPFIVCCKIALRRKMERKHWNESVLKYNQNDFVRIPIVDLFGSATKAKFQTNQLSLCVARLFIWHSAHSGHNWKINENMKLAESKPMEKTIWRKIYQLNRDEFGVWGQRNFWWLHE